MNGRLRFAIRPDVLKRARGPEARADTSVVVRTHLIIRVVDRGTKREGEEEAEAGHRSRLPVC